MIRRIKPHDYKAIYEVNEICHEVFEPNISLLEKLKTCFTWVAEEDGKIIGFLISRLMGLEVNIYNVAVLPIYRGKGIATSLIAECEKFYPGHRIYLHVNVSNPALKLYSHLGYRIERIKENFYGDCLHAALMYKVLGANSNPR